MGEAIPEGQCPLGRVGDVILAQVRDRVGQRPVEIDPALLGQRQDHVGGGDHLGHRGEVEPVILRQRLRLGQQRGHAGKAYRALPVGGHDPERRAGDAAGGDSLGRGRECPFGDRSIMPARPPVGRGRG